MSEIMTLDALMKLRDRLQDAAQIELSLVADVVPLIARHSSGAEDVDAIAAQLMESTDGALRTVGAAFPDWAITLEGHTVPIGDAAWKCVFCKSRGDDDQLVGIGHGAGIRLSLLAAITHLEIMRAQGYA